MPPFDSRIFERAEELVDRRRLVIGLCAAVAVALIAAIPGVLTSADDSRSVATGEFTQVTSTTGLPIVIPVPGAPAAPAPTPLSPTTTSPAVVLASTFDRPTTTVPPKHAAPTTAAKPAPPPSTPNSTGTSAPFCHNSYDPACGPFRWDTPPQQNQPRTVTLSSGSQTGMQVTIHAVVNDPDDAQAYKCPATTYDFGDGIKESRPCDPPPGTNPCPTRYGPWSLPDRSAGGGQEDVVHTYNNPGPYTVTFTYDPGYEDACYNPYADGASGSIPITVT